MSGIANWQAQIRIDIEDLKKRIKVAEGEINNFTNEDRKVKLDIDTKTLESAIQKLDKMLDSLGKGTGDFKQFENLSKELSSIVLEVQSLSKAFGKLDDSGAKTLLSSIQNIDRSLSDLSQHILNVNKNMGNMGNNTSGAVKQVENIGNAYQDAAKEAEKLADAQSKIGQKTNISSTSNQKKDAFPGSSTDTKSETGGMEQVEKATDEAVQAKKDFATANEGVQSSIDGSKSPLQLEAELMDQIAKSAREAADAKKEFVEANNKVKDSADESNSDLKAKPKKDRYAKRRKVSEEDFLNYSPNRVNEKLSNSGYTILGETVNTELVDGLVKVSAKIKDVDGVWKSFSAKVDADGNIFEQRFKTVTNGVDKLETALKNFGREISPALTYQETLDKAQKIKNSLNLGDEYSIKVDSSEFVTITKKLTDVENAGSSVTQTFKSAQDAIDNFGKATSNSAEKTSVALKSIKSNVKEVVDETEKLANAQKEQNTNVNFNGYDKRLDSYNGKVDKYQATIDRFNEGGWTSDTYLKNVQAVRDAVKQYATIIDNIKTNQNGIATDEDIQNLDKYEKKIKDTIATVTNMSASEKGYNFVSSQKELDKIHKLLEENSRMSSEAKAKIKAYYKQIESDNPSMSLDKIHGEIMKIVNAEKEAGRAGKSMWSAIKEKAWYGIAGAITTYLGFNDFLRYGREAIETVREFDTALTEMRKVSDETVQSLKNYQSITFDTADAVGTTAKQIQNSTADYMRLGESLEEAAESAKTANILLNVSEFNNIEDATKSLVSMGQAYKDLDKMTIVDKLNEIGNNYSISTDELATSLQKSAATLSLMGNSIDEAASLVTTANATIQDADSVSAGLRTISLRLVGTEEAEKELSAMNEEVDAFVKATNSKKQQIIKDYTAVASNSYKGFDILDDNGNYKNTYEILLGIAKVYKEIQEQDKKLGTNHATALIEELAGKNRSNIASAILQDPAQLEAVKKSSEEAFGSATEELNKYLDSIDGKMAQLQNRAQEFWFKIIDSETIKNGIDLLSTLLKGTTDFVDTVGLLPTLFTGISAALSFKNVGIGTLVAYQSNHCYCFDVPTS